MELLHPNDLPVDAMKQSKHNTNIQVILENLLYGGHCYKYQYTKPSAHSTTTLQIPKEINSTIEHCQT